MNQAIVAADISRVDRSSHTVYRLLTNRRRI